MPWKPRVAYASRRGAVAISDEDSDSDEYGYDPEVTLESIRASKTITLSISANYTNWAPREAFRELVQNWRDGIIRSFRLVERDFSVVRDEKTSDRGTEIVYKVFRTGANDVKEWLGYIRFHAKGSDSAGTIDMTNRAATLQPRHLDLGGTTKAGDSHQAGAHGEGLKLALLVLMRGRQNHSVRCCSGGFNWRFDFTTRGRLVCRLHRMSPQAIQRAEDQARRLSERTLLPFAAKPAGDVQFVVGESQKGRDERGNGLQRSGVTRREFDDWTKAALFLCDNVEDGAIISTAHGDLLTDPGLRGNIYLKGLLLGESTPARSASITNRPLRFGYNFANGRTNRERQSVYGASEESAAILAIWDGVLTAKPDMAAELSEMLNDPAPLPCADIFGARNMCLETATVLRGYLTGQPFSGKWYYSGEDKAKNPRLGHIIEGLGYEGVELTKTYWTTLRRHDLLRTAEEEEQRRFKAASLIADTDVGSAFAASVRRLLRACGHACPKTKGMAFRFVEAGQLHLQLFYSETEGLFRVHGRWLSARSAVYELGLPDHVSEADAIFHTVKRLFSEALKRLPADVFDAIEPQDARTAEWRRRLEIRLSEQRLLGYLRLVGSSVRVVPDAVGLLVTLGWWPDSARDVDAAAVEIQCHRASRCAHLRSELLTAEDARVDKMICTPASQDGDACRVYRNHHARGELARLDGLKDGEDYFVVLLTPGDPDSLVGVSDVVRWTLPRTTTTTGAAAAAPRRSMAASPPSTPARCPKSRRRLRLHTSSVRPEILGRNDDGVFSPEGDTNTDPAGDGVSPSPPSSPLFSSGSNARGNIFTTPAREPTDPATPTAVATAATAAAAGSPPGIIHTPGPTSFVLGPRLSTLDIFRVDREQWYEARSEHDDNLQAVIGILPDGRKDLPEGEASSRKRRRT